MAVLVTVADCTITPFSALEVSESGTGSAAGSGFTGVGGVGCCSRNAVSPAGCSVLPCDVGGDNVFRLGGVEFDRDVDVGVDVDAGTS